MVSQKIEAPTIEKYLERTDRKGTELTSSPIRSRERDEPSTAISRFLGFDFPPIVFSVQQFFEQGSQY